MGRVKGLCSLVMTAAVMLVTAFGGRIEARALERAESLRMENVSYRLRDPLPLGDRAAKAEERLLREAVPAVSAALTPVSVQSVPDASLLSLDEEIMETTIEGGLTVKNETGYEVDIGSVLLEGPAVRLKPDTEQILIIHTHSSEAYTPAGLDRYNASDSCRTEDVRYNIVRVGDELAQILENAGLKVIHDRSIYDYPSYTGSYNRSGEAVQQYLKDYPDIAVVIDLHRDALGSDGVVYKTMAEEQGVCASQVMMLVGTDASGLSHGRWRDNLSLALYLQERVSAAHPTLMRPVSIVKERYNQHLCTGSLILEVGSSGNTLQEALAAARLFGRAAAPALAALVETEGEGET